MTLASDQNKNDALLSDNARQMLALRDDVFSTWEGRVRTKLSEARTLQHPILIDTLPVFYDNIAESISPNHSRLNGVDGTTVAAEHGGERARVTSYDHAALIREYQILRWAIFEVLRRNDIQLDHQETHIIHSSIDSGIQQAVEAFSLVQSGFRERFAAALAHDMRGPLTSVVIGLELLLITDDPTRIKLLAAKALTSSQRISGMVDELLDTMAFHGGQTLQLTLGSVDLMELAKEVQSDATALFGPRIRLLGESVHGTWDRKAMKRALENLVSNAVKYGNAATPITIQLNEVHGRLLLSVHNEGPPIPPLERECIFQMYRRAEASNRSSKEGWGIGLPYVRAVAESHGGSIGLDSNEENGTTFVIDIPVDGRLLGGSPTLARG